MRVRWKEFELPTRVAVDEKTATPTYAVFHAEPFERGFATTIGNSLRRVLYSSIEGAAVTSIKIKGASHEFTAIEGVVEDVTDIVLNLKQLVVRVAEDGKKTLRIEATKKGAVKAGQIVAEAGVEVINPDLHLCTLAEEGAEFSAEITVSKGRRYVTSEEQSRDSHEPGIIPVDSSFSPIKRVRYRVENTRVGKLTNYERLVLEVWTNGTVSPEEAVTEASKILRKHLNPFVQYFELGRELQINEKKEEELRKKEGEKEELRQKLSMSISELDLSVRSANCLSSEKIETIGELVGRSEAELLKVRNFGKTSLREVKKKLSDMGLTLGMDLEAIFGKKAPFAG
jgi:DNA-directed RNA polymerase subunit alpha